jgi:uncharacterized membrane protein
MMFLWLIPVVYIIYLLSDPHRSPRDHHRSSDDALAIFNKRLALGEIDEEEYERKTSLLS